MVAITVTLVMVMFGEPPPEGAPRFISGCGEVGAGRAEVCGAFPSAGYHPSGRQTQEALREESMRCWVWG